MAWRSYSLHEKRSQVQWGNKLFQKEETDNWVTKKREDESEGNLHTFVIDKQKIILFFTLVKLWNSLSPFHKTAVACGEKRNPKTSTKQTPQKPQNKKTNKSNNNQSDSKGNYQHS